MSAANTPAKRLSIVSLGKLLHLAELLKIERENDRSTLDEVLAAAAQEVSDIGNNTFERQSVQRDIELLLQSLSDEAKRDVIGLFYLGRNVGDDFNGLRVNTAMSMEVMPWFISDKTDLHDSLIKGLKRFAECGSTMGDKGAGWIANDAVVYFPPNLDGVHVVEWSDVQRAYRIVLLTDSLRTNFRQWLDGQVNDYRQIALCHSREEALVIIRHMQKLRPKYEQPMETMP